MTKRIRVAVVFGGRSTEHEVSLVSARSVMAAMDPQRFEIVPIGVTKEGRWLVSGDPMRELTEGGRGAGPAGGGARPMLPGVAEPSSRSLEAVRGRTEAGKGIDPPDVVFPLVHGIYGEDGTLQGLLDMAGLPYVGAGVIGSAVGMDKDVSRRLLGHAGLPVVRTHVIPVATWTKEGKGARIESALSEIGLPCFVKPACSGSSVGVTKVRDARDLEAAVDDAFQYDTKALVERAVDAREIEVAVLGNDAPEASIPGEIVPCREFYDYAAKYVEDSRLLIPAPLEGDQTAEVRRLALEAFRLLEMAGLARVDFFLDRQDGRFYINEVNTLPGFTPISMYPRLWEASGVPYRELITRLITLALERHDRRKLLKTSYEPARP